MSNEKKLKIGFFTPFFFPAWRFGGPVKNSYELGRRLVTKGHQVYVYTTDLSNNASQRTKLRKIVKEGMKIYYFKNFSNRLASYYNLFLPIEMRNYISSEIQNLDIIHLQDIYTIISFWLYRKVKKLNTPFFITTRGVLSYQSQNKYRLIKIFLRKFIIKLLKSANAVFVQTENERKDCIKLGLNNIKLLNNGIDVDEFSNLPKKSVFRKKYNFSMDDIIILYLGRINKVKGLKYLVEAFSKLSYKRDIKLVLVGPDDNYFNELIKKQKLGGNFLYINGLYGDEKMEAYASADIFCLPSIYDCSPNSMLEACAAGLPIITTSTNGLSDLIQNSAGIVIPPRNSVELSNALLLLIENPRLRKSYSIHAREIAIHNYSWKKILDSLESAYFKSLK